MENKPFTKENLDIAAKALQQGEIVSSQRKRCMD